MSRRAYDQACSLATALDHVGERWTLLIVRELSLGPLRFSELARSVGGAPTDVLTKRLRDLEADGVVSKRRLEAPVAATVYELTELGRGLERPMFELARWGMNLQRAEAVVDLAPSSLPNAMRVLLQPPAEASFVVGLRTGSHEFTLRARDGWIEASRGGADDAGLVLAGSPVAVLAFVVVGEEAADRVEIEGDRALLEEVRAMVVLPERLREESRELVEAGVLDRAATAAA
ncbi:MAG TPA: helix-turn-helix domain-containing protein [Solirubrobacterales bacterium]|nr:helix-turn-helix domain-containing protein [Solirubrobacterales bacterium]